MAADGGVFAYGTAPFEGAASSVALNSPIVDMVPTADGLGYWEVAADGGVFAYGDAGIRRLAGWDGPGHTDGRPWPPTRRPVATGWSSANGNVTAFNAPNLGPAADALPATPVVGIAATADGKGYWEVTRSGAVYAYGDAAYQGPAAALDPAAPIVSITAQPGSGGYWLVGADGGVFAYGAGYYGAG